jgi:hypothetical protein
MRLITDKLLNQIIFVLCLIFSGVVWSEDADIWQQDFENRLPGQIPEGWSKVWGCPLREDIFTTSNVEVLSGKRSLLLERQYYNEKGQYGLGKLTPSLNASMVKVVIPFLLKDSTAYGASFSILLRSTKNKDSTLAELRVANGKTTFCNRKLKKFKELGKFELGTWYRFVVKLPLEADGKNIGSAKFERRQIDGSWKQYGDSSEVKTAFSIAKNRRLSIQIIPGTTGTFKLFIDDISVEQITVKQ